jgi:hypothetical protein
LVHSLIGKKAYKELGWFMAEDLVPYISTLLSNDIPDGK